MSKNTDVISVSMLNLRVQSVLEASLGYVWVEGEISNLVKAASGHWYFTLKDTKAQVRCAMFKGSNRSVKIPVKNGDKVQAFCQVTLYPLRGDYQLIVSKIRAAGLGDLNAQFEAIKKKLNDEGLFAQELKKNLPKMPKAIGVITSPSGAAIRDIIHVLERRFPLAAVVIYPCLVQGVQAATQIKSALKTANIRNEVDVLIIGRGGGSLEDLWCFNDESLARMVSDSTIPTVSAVGHETDFTICDFVSDLRAPTPSAAAECVSPNLEDIRYTLNDYLYTLANWIESKLNNQEQSLDHLTRALKILHPSHQLDIKGSELKHLTSLLVGLTESKLEELSTRINSLNHRLVSQSAGSKIEISAEKLNGFNQKIQQLMLNKLQTNESRIGKNAALLNALSPLNTLGRGYSIVKNAENGKVISSVKKLTTGQELKLSFKDGIANTITKEIVPNS